MVMSLPLTFIAFLVLDAVHLVTGRPAVGVILSDPLTLGVGSLNSGGMNFFLYSTCAYGSFLFFVKVSIVSSMGKT